MSHHHTAAGPSVSHPLGINGASNFFIPEYEQIISLLERGTVVTKFYPRKRPERRTMMIRRETRQIIWSRSASTKIFEGSGELHTPTPIHFSTNKKSSEGYT
jgi:phosphatidylinositol phospholipase C gamma-1